LEQLVILSEKLGRWNHVANGLQTAGLYVPLDLQLPLCGSRPEQAPVLPCRPSGQSLRRASDGVHKLILELDTGLAKQQHLAVQHMRELRRQRTLHLDVSPPTLGSEKHHCRHILSPATRHWLSWVQQC
jgi:hypothetical protein